MKIIHAMVVAAATFSLTAGAAPASAAKVALWHMNETSGTWMVDSVGRNDGTLHNVTQPTGSTARRATCRCRQPTA